MEEILFALAGLAGGGFAGMKVGAKKALQAEWAKDVGWYTVFGLWHDPEDPDRSERYALHVETHEWQGAEDEALWRAENEVGGKLLIAATVKGKFDQADRATFADRHIKRMDGTTGLFRDAPTI